MAVRPEGGGAAGVPAVAADRQSARRPVESLPWHRHSERLVPPLRQANFTVKLLRLGTHARLEVERAGQAMRQ